jgi:hypothetical protein
MVKTILKKGWIGPLKQSSEGKQPWVCDYCCPLTGKKKRKSIAAAGTNKKERERMGVQCKTNSGNGACDNTRG